MKDDPITKVRVTGQWKYEKDIPEEAERKLTGNVYVNSEFESWAENKPSRIMALKDQRKSYEHYKPNQVAVNPMMTMDGSNYLVSRTSLTYYRLQEAPRYSTVTSLKIGLSTRLRITVRTGIMLTLTSRFGTILCLFWTV